MATRSAVTVDGITVAGVDVDSETRCAHYARDRDVLAIKFSCCGDYYPCLACHDECTDHECAAWPRTEFDTVAILCGRCGTALTIDSYLDCGATCPSCGGAFNPECRTHWPVYFDVDDPPSGG